MKSNSEFMALKEDMGDLCKSRQILLSLSLSLSLSLCSIFLIYYLRVFISFGERVPPNNMMQCIAKTKCVVPPFARGKTSYSQFGSRLVSSSSNPTFYPELF